MAAYYIAVAAAAVMAFMPASGAFVSPTQRTPISTVVHHHSISSSSSSSSSLHHPTAGIKLSQQSSIISSSRRRRTSLAATATDTVPTTTLQDECDVLVLGSGPAARSIATLLASSTSSSDDASPSYDILLADANYDRKWIPNYGVWQDEWQSILDLYASFNQPIGSECIDRLWKVTDCFFGGSFDIPVEQRMRLDRPYCRVDRHALRRTLSPEGTAKYRVLRANHIAKATSVNIYSPGGSIVHDESGSTAILQSKDGNDVTQVRAKLIVDCTGHESRIVLKDDRVKSIPPGFQIAYGILATIDESSIPDKEYCGPYYKEAMTLFDYRTDHFPTESNELSKAEKSPTFMYAMPLSDNRIFFEETSLVARPAISFEECKERCMTRLEHLGIKVTDIEEEEFCYIPMGGPLPAKDQRIVGFGGSSAMVHPSTGYHLCRAMMGAGNVARVIREELSKNGSGNAGWNPDRAAARAYDAIWSPTNVAQRNFAVFGGEFLMKQNVEGLRGFFEGFFKLDLPSWGGFLAGWPGLPNNENHETWWARLKFGLTFVSKLPPQVALDMLASIATYSITEGVPLPQSVTPLLGLPDGYGYKEKPAVVGDVAAKAEARRMISESQVEDVVPVDFDETNS